MPSQKQNRRWWPLLKSIGNGWLSSAVPFAARSAAVHAAAGRMHVGCMLCRVKLQCVCWSCWVCLHASALWYEGYVVVLQRCWALQCVGTAGSSFSCPDLCQLTLTLPLLSLRMNAAEAENQIQSRVGFCVSFRCSYFSFFPWARWRLVFIVQLPHAVWVADSHCNYVSDPKVFIAQSWFEPKRRWHMAQRFHVASPPAFQGQLWLWLLLWKCCIVLFDIRAVS